jgi:hypothetical protein
MNISCPSKKKTVEKYIKIDKNIGGRGSRTVGISVKRRNLITSTTTTKLLMLFGIWRIMGLRG